MASRPGISASSFQNALDRFKSKSGLTSQELADMGTTTLPQLQRALDMMQQKQKATRSMKHLKRLQPFLAAMKQYSQVVDVFANTSDCVAFIWGPIKFLLTVAFNFSDAFNALLEGYLTIGDNMPLLEQYQQLFENNKYMQTALTSIFEDILDFHLEAVKLFKQKALRQLYHATWRTLGKNIEEITTSLQRHKSIIETQATLVEYEQFQAFRAQTKAEFAELQISERDRRYARVQDWLSPIDSRARDEAASRERFLDTGLWLLQDDRFRHWFLADQCMDPLLWLCGMPGAGKTILASLVFAEANRVPDAVALCFYCRYTDEQKNGFLAVAKSLISQVLPKNDSVLDYLYEEVSKSGEASLTTIALAQTLLEVVLKSCKLVYIVLDGLDEYAREDRKELVTWFQQLIAGLPRNDHGAIRCLFVSQDDGYGRKDFSMLSTIKITHADNNADIKRFCEHWHERIEVKFGKLQERQHHVANVVSARAQGMFLFAKLVTWNLHEQVSRADFEKEIDEERLPDNIDKAYDRILGRLVATTVPQTRRNNIRKLLGWLACARRPLKWHEIQGANSVDLDHSVICPKQQFTEDCKELCLSLVEIAPDQTVTLVHSTTRPYLVHKGFFRMSEIECGMATLCVAYLNMPEFESNREEAAVKDSYLKGAYSFADYAMCFWALHVEAALINANELDANLLKELTESIEIFLDLHLMDQATPEVVPSKVYQCLKILEQHDYYDQACQAVAAAKSWLRPSRKKPLTDVSLRLPRVMYDIRAIIEPLSSSQALSDEERGLVVQYYGFNHYKCSRMNCQFFHRGFPTDSQRDQHTSKHDRSFICMSFGCPYAIIGFATSKELEKHMLSYHGIEANPEELEFPDIASLQPLRKKHPSSHKCDICSKTFTRKHNLMAHLRTHANERPFVCNVCKQGFARQHDRKRHEAIHVGEKAYICGKRPHFVSGEAWGCGRGFARADSLGLHWRSEPGRICLKQMLQEKKAAEERRAQELRDKTTRSAFFDQDFGDNQNFDLDFSTLENSDVLENFDFDSFLNTTNEDTFNFDTGIGV
ncbi:hypothetical protein LTR84_012664 [Exophiala bonariae]|uniref:C2H2-type domain-containing protein n=1 Tax=Exophiala bonariae TaxID=1690606 RepID=A0AAV9NIB5_9EURO|nr:hypothetical protein LTR84_012664 [Exophiala bonariae]